MIFNFAVYFRRVHINSNINWFGFFTLSRRGNSYRGNSCTPPLSSCKNFPPNFSMVHGVDAPGACKARFAVRCKNNNAFQSTSDHSQWDIKHAFCLCDIDLMTLIHEPKRYLRTKMKFLGQGFQNLRAPTGQTDRRDQTYYHAAFMGRKSQK